MTTHSWEQRLQEQKADFILRSLERLASMDALVTNAELRTGDVGVVKKLMRHFHQLAGSGGIYSMTELCDLAGRGEEMCLFMLQHECPVSQSDAIRFRLIMKSLRQILEGQGAEVTAEQLPPRKEAGPELKPAVVIACNDLETTSRLREQFTMRDLEVRTFGTSSGALSEIKSILPEALVIDVPLVDSPEQGFELARHLRQLPAGQAIPVVILCRDASFRKKIHAIRCGADAIFEHPVDFDLLADKVRRLVHRGDETRSRILSVEDDPDQSDFIKSTLETAGYEVVSLSDPAKFEETLAKHLPDLLLLDVVLGDMNGFELSRFVRQNDRFAALPIIFLTTQNHINAHIAGMRAGGDHYLIKPVRPELLVSAVAARLERYRAIRALIRQDGLTQCLNYSAFMDEASKICKPDPHRFSLSMLAINIDKTDELNRTFGYALADQFVAALARLVKETFRQSALVGRIGGDEFAVIVENALAPELKRLGEQIVADFSQVEILVAGQAQRATASGSVGSLDPAQDFTSFLRGVRDGLARAKKAGGNCVISLGEPAEAHMYR